MSPRLVNEVDGATIVGLDSELRQEVFPEVARRLNDVRVLSGPDSSEDGVVAGSLEAGWGELVAFANSRAFGTVLLDLDHFKDINDTFGHGIGDEVLAAGVALQSTVRESNFVGRYGGEEFIMLLPDADRETTLQVAERVRTAIAAINVLEGDSAVTASFGVAVFPEDAPDAARLVRNADRALYRAKANGRNRVEIFSLDAATEDEPGPGTIASATPASS